MSQFLRISVANCDGHCNNIANCDGHYNNIANGDGHYDYNSVGG